MENLTIATVYKRILSFVIDSIIVILIAVILFFPVEKIVENTELYHTNYSLYQEEFNKSKLFIINEGKRIKLNEADIVYHYDTYVSTLHKYYTEYCNNEKENEYKTYWFSVNVLGLDDVLERYSKEHVTSTYFEYTSNNLELPKLIISSEKINFFDDSINKVALNSIDRFFIEKYEAAVNDFESNKVYGTEAYRKIVLTSFIAPVIALMVGMLIFVLIIPIIDKEHRTLGKRFLKLAVIDKEGFRLTIGKSIIRQLVLIFIDIILGVVTIGGMTLISYTCLILSKSKQSLHDRIVGSVVIRSDQSDWYESKEARDQALIEEEIANGK